MRGFLHPVRCQIDTVKQFPLNFKYLVKADFYNTYINLSTTRLVSTSTNMSTRWEVHKALMALKDLQAASQRENKPASQLDRLSK